eukprot:TRINITY_DN1515_c0_g1_i8.p2 TRINITY_DN1515_c0_g1~~TRINITY_DN1515_c0_g1_i8.p2  ORF type:complete len:253 (-),score=25.47 TRINITY_DN1515_c0_g1_i8:333-986(-)
MTGLHRTATAAAAVVGLTALACLAEVGVAHAQPPEPTWPTPFFSEFEEVTVRGNTTGWYAIDLQQGDGGSQAVYRADGHADNICGLVKPASHEPCVQLATGAYRYLVWPQSNECCICCDRSAGCGPLSPGWVSNATFEGVETIREHSCNAWSVGPGPLGRPDLIMQTQDSEAKVCFISDSLSDNITFHLETWTGTVDPKYFRLPSNCNTRCGKAPCK